MSRDLQDTLESAREDLQTWMDENPGARDAGDTISEIADSSVPVYTGDILAVAAEDISLATDTPDIGPAFDGSPTPVNIIAANIYERIEADLWEYYRQHEDERLCAYCEERYDDADTSISDEGKIICDNCKDELFPEVEEEEEPEDEDQ